MANLQPSPKKHFLVIKRTVCAYLALACLAPSLAFAQDVPSPTSVFLQNQVVRIANVPSLTAQSSNLTAVLATCLETVIHDKDVCCGKDSGLEDVVLSASSLKDVGAKAQGRHVLSDGLSVNVQAEYFQQGSISDRFLVSKLMDQQPILIERKSQVYVVYGAVYDETRTYNPDGWQFTIHKLLLLDPRFSDHRRESELNNDADDWKTIQALIISVVRQ